MKKGLILGLVFCTLSSCIHARENIVEQFKNNSAIIYTINIRNFASQDKDNDGIITTSLFRNFSTVISIENGRNSMIFHIFLLFLDIKNLLVIII